MSDRPLAARFLPGFIGEPGDRTFLFEVDDAIGRVWYLLEKGQVAAFAEQAGALLDELGMAGSGLALNLGEINEPEAIEFRIGEITIAVERGAQQIEITLVPVEASDPPAVHLITPAQLDAAVRAARLALPQGRPLCPRCGLAMDPEGHACPTTNGDLRHHRP